MMNYLIKRNDGRELDLFDSLFAPIFSSEKSPVMRTDVKKTEKGYLMEVEIPGYDKSEISVEYEKGNLTILAEKKEAEEKAAKEAAEKEAKAEKAVKEAIEKEDWEGLAKLIKFNITINKTEYKNAEEFTAVEWTAEDFNKEAVKEIVKNIVENQK
jgi:hypothetical protein